MRERVLLGHHPPRRLLLDVKEELSIRIAGEIALSKDPAKTIRKWREAFGLTQMDLASRLEVSASVVSDYESGRRTSPGVRMVRRIVDALIQNDLYSGSPVLRAYEKILRGGMDSEAILDLREFLFPVTMEEVCRRLEATIVSDHPPTKKALYGYTVLDSLRAILEMPSEEFLRVYGQTSERALIFTKVSSGRSPFVAIRVSSIKPGLVILHGLEKIDPFALKMAEKDHIPVAISKIESVEALLTRLREEPLW
jgi:putative transcriptional regulator